MRESERDIYKSCMYVYVHVFVPAMCLSKIINDWRNSMLNGKPFYSNGSFTLPEMDSGKAGTQDSCPVQKEGVGILVRVSAMWTCST